MFDNGFITVEDLDDEELRLGKCRGANGKIPKSSTKTEMVPRDLYDEMVLEHQKRTDEKLRQQLDTMLEVMVDVATDDTVEPRDRMDAAKYLFERVAGKTAERVAITVEKAPWEEVFSGVAKISRERSHALRDGAIDAEVVEAPDVSERPPGPPEPEPTVPPEHYVAPYGAGPFEPAPKAPSWDNPVSSSATIPSDRREPPPEATQSTSEQLREMQSAAADLAARKANARKRIQDAKKRRIVQRATGANVLRGKEIHAELTDDKLSFQIGSEDG